LEVNDKNIEGYVTLADAHYLMKNPEKSFEIIEKGMAIDPKSVDLWRQKAWTNYTADHEQFKRDYEQVIRLDPNNTRSYILLIEEYLWDDETDKAIRCYERLLLYNPTFSTSFDEIVANIAKLKEETCMCETSVIYYDDEED
jgi:tetratricopeptide (TPR) repeat protein